MSLFSDPVAEVLNPYLHFKTMLELGNKRTKGKAWKHYFEAQGIQHTSVDLNGKDGSLRLDLTEPLNLGKFEVVTNFGTTEHVLGQKAVWENIHNSCGDTLICLTPSPGYWTWHGRYYPHPEFYTSFAELNGYKITKQFEHSRDNKRREIYVRMVKTSEKPYTHPDEDLMYVNHEGKLVGCSSV